MRFFALMAIMAVSVNCQGATDETTPVPTVTTSYEPTTPGSVITTSATTEHVPTTTGRVSSSTSGTTSDVSTTVLPEEPQQDTAALVGGLLGGLFSAVTAAGGLMYRFRVPLLNAWRRRSNRVAPMNNIMMTTLEAAGVVTGTGLVSRYSVSSSISEAGSEVVFGSLSDTDTETSV